MFEALGDQFTFKCVTCGQVHVGLPDLAFDSPFHYYAMTETERRETAELTADTCVIAKEDFFVRGLVEIPILGRSDQFAYGAWVSLSPDNFERFQVVEERDPSKEPPYFGWFCNKLPGYPDTLNLKTKVYLRPHPQRPRIELEPTDHPLAVEQRNGI